MRDLDNHNASVEQDILSEAHRAGFSSVGEYNKARYKDEEKREAAWRQQVEEEIGMTWEDYWATHHQRAETPPRNMYERCGWMDPPSFLTTLISNMTDHLALMFCLKGLVEAPPCGSACGSTRPSRISASV